MSTKSDRKDSNLQPPGCDAGARPLSYDPSRAPAPGFEPGTSRLTDGRSSAELRRNGERTWRRVESNHRPRVYETLALSAELHRRARPKRSRRDSNPQPSGRQPAVLACWNYGSVSRACGIRTRACRIENPVALTSCRTPREKAVRIAGLEPALSGMARRRFRRLSYIRVENGEPGRPRTCDIRLKRTALFQLSYGPVVKW